jgi:hypothetical protein
MTILCRYLFLRVAQDEKDIFIINKEYFQIGNQVYFPTQFESCQSELNSTEENVSKTKELFVKTP